jgi:hypothetical protein
MDGSHCRNHSHCSTLTDHLFEMIFQMHPSDFCWFSELVKVYDGSKTCHLLGGCSCLTSRMTISYEICFIPGPLRSITSCVIRNSAGLLPTVAGMRRVTLANYHHWTQLENFSSAVFLAIQSLPDDILYSVFHHLSYWRIFVLRSVHIWSVYYLTFNSCVPEIHHQTCWGLYIIGKSGPLWQSKALETSHSSGVPLLQEPIEKTCQKQRNLDTACFQWWEIPIGYLYCARYELKWSRGGRWLLLNWGGRVNIMDLGIPEPMREPLFDANDSADPLFRSTI